MTWSKRIEVLLAVAMALGVGLALGAGCWTLATIIATGMNAWLWMAFTQPDYTEEEERP